MDESTVKRRSISKIPSPALEAKIDAIVENIEKNQGADGYFNIYFTVCEPGKRYRLTLSEDGSALTVEELEC